MCIYVYVCIYIERERELNTDHLGRRHAETRMCIRVCMHVCMCMCIYIYIYIYMYTHVCV